MCGSVRLTSYEIFAQGWCEFPRDLPMLPAFVREEGLTAAIAEPFAGSSYGGGTGESCGECWEVDTVYGTRTVMITDLCPNDGNPLCRGPNFHLDLAADGARVISGGDQIRVGGLDEGSARRVACPVEGNIHIFVNDHNYAYYRASFVNLRVPLRSVEWQAVGAGVTGANPWTPLARSSGAWHAEEMDPLDRGGDGIVFRLTSAQGQTVTSAAVIPTHPDRQTAFDLGVQFDDMMPTTGGACEFVPPGDVYLDQWGGIDQVTWDINPWGEAESGFFGPVSEGCAEGTSCVRLDNFGQYSGFFFHYRQRFPADIFSRMTMQVRANVAGEILVGISDEGERCAEYSFAIGPEYREIEIDVAGDCAGRELINQIVVSNPGPTMQITLDEVRLHL